MSVPLSFKERERKSRVCLERPLFHSPRQTDTYSLSLHNRGGKQKYNTHITKNTYILSQKQKTIYYTTIFSKKNQKRTTALHSTIVPHTPTHPSNIFIHQHSLILILTLTLTLTLIFSLSTNPTIFLSLITQIFSSSYSSKACAFDLSKKKWLLCLTIVRAYYSL